MYAFESGHTPSCQECRGIGEIFVQFYPTHTVIRNSIFTDRLASLGGTIINLVVDKAYVWREEMARHAVHYLGGTNSWVHCIIPVSHSCKDALGGVQWS